MTPVGFTTRRLFRLTPRRQLRRFFRAAEIVQLVRPGWRMLETDARRERPDDASRI